MIVNEHDGVAGRQQRPIEGGAQGDRRFTAVVHCDHGSRIVSAIKRSSVCVVPVTPRASSQRSAPAAVSSSCSARLYRYPWVWAPAISTTPPYRDRARDDRGLLVGLTRTLTPYRRAAAKARRTSTPSCGVHHNPSSPLRFFERRDATGESSATRRPFGLATTMATLIARSASSYAGAAEGTCILPTR